MQQETWFASKTHRFRAENRRVDTGWLAVFVLCLVVTAWLPAQAQDLQSELKSEFIERFTRLIEWPASAGLADSGSPFVIGVVGDTHMRAALDDLAGRTRIKGKAVQIRSYGNAAAIGACHLLFVGDGVGGELTAVLQRVAGKPVLTVSDSSGFAKRGVMINFVVDEGFVRFELNRRSAEEAGLSLADALVGLAEVVD